MSGLRYGSVCSGIEAASVAWEPLGWDPVFFSEIEKFPCAVLAHHYGSNMPGEPHAGNGVPNFGDMTKFEEWPDVSIDLLVGGTPCQDYSIAGNRAGMDGDRGQLTLVYVQVLGRYLPSWFVWENVPGVFSSNGGRDFARFLGDLTGQQIEVPGGGWKNGGIIPGIPEAYGCAYRVLDTQFTRVDGFEKASPQRRRRVFVIGYLGDWRPAAAVLFESESLQGNPPPRRETGQGFAADVVPSLTGSGSGVSSTGEGRGQDPVVAVNQAFGGGNCSGPIEVAAALAAHGTRQDCEVETFVAAPLTAANHYGDQAGRESQLVAHTLSASHDASEDGSGRGTPIVPVAFDCKASGRNGFSVGEVSPTLRAMGSKSSHQNAGGQVAVAWPLTAGMAASASRMPHEQGALLAYGFEDRARGDDGRGYDRPPHFSEGVAPAMGTVKPPAMAQGYAVRRLMPEECESLQCFPKNHTRIPWNGKGPEECPDGPRYKALGNSKSINVVRAIGQRIALVDRLIKEGGL